jgi:hypothetical protein
MEGETPEASHDETGNLPEMDDRDSTPKDSESTRS